MRTLKQGSNGGQNVLQGALVLAASAFIVKLIGAFFKVPLANIIGGTGMGYFMTAYDLFNPVRALAIAGIPVAVSKMVSEAIATGRYARVERLPSGRFALRQSVTAAKDQTYALYNLTQEQLARTLMPVGAYHKEAIRKMAEDLGLPVANKPDSQEICFIPDHDYAAFLDWYTGSPMPEGNFVDLEGNVLGRHKGISHYTVGQRKGLNLAMGYPVFVVKIRPETNEVVIGNGQDVYTSRVYCNKINWMSVDGLHGRDMEVTAKIRYNHKGQTCVIREAGEDLVECVFAEPVRAAAPGQAAVFYRDDYVVGGGTIL